MKVKVAICVTIATHTEKYFKLFCVTAWLCYIYNMKRTFLTIELDPELKEHIDKQAIRKKITISRYVRAALKKVSKYKEPDIL